MSGLEFIVHRGSHQIGGTCIEIRCEDSRIVLDCGLPLTSLDGSGEENHFHVAHPAVPGLFGAGPPVDAILLSHAHPDHSGMIQGTNSSIPVFSSRLSFKMAMAASIFANLPGIGMERERTLKPGVRTPVGRFAVTAFPVDHSIPGACAFAIEVMGKRILYTGDLRFHGRKPGMRDAVIAAGRDRRFDWVFTEGTTLSRSPAEQSLSESDLEEEDVALIVKRAGLVAAHFSPLNLDRFVSFVRIAKRAGRTFLTDPYGAYVLMLARGEGIRVPDPCRSEDIRILIPDGFWRTRAGRAIRAHRSRMESHSIGFAEVLEQLGRFLMLWRPSMRGSLPAGTLCLRSLWKGYLETEGERQLADRFEQSGVEQRHLHASGHANRVDLVNFLKDMDPQRIIVVHSERPDELRREIENVISIDDGIPMTM